MVKSRSLVSEICSIGMRQNPRPFHNRRPANSFARVRVAPRARTSGALRTAGSGRRRRASTGPHRQVATRFPTHRRRRPAARRYADFNPCPPGLGKSDGDGLAPRAYIAAAAFILLHFLADEFAGLRCGLLALPRVTVCALESGCFGHGDKKVGSPSYNVFVPASMGGSPRCRMGNGPKAGFRLPANDASPRQ